MKNNVVDFRLKVGDDTFGQSTVQNFKDNSVNTGQSVKMLGRGVKLCVAALAPVANSICLYFIQM